MVGADDAVCVDCGVVGGCDFNCAFGTEVAVLILFAFYNMGVWMSVYR